MSKANGLSEDDITIKDEENYTDKKIKQRILNTRDMLNEAKFELFAGRLTEPDVEVSQQQALFAWGDLVRSYLRDLGVLLYHEDLPGAEYYREKVEIGEIQIIPPDKDDYQFSLVAQGQLSAEELRRHFGLGRGAELPQPRTRQLRGLASVIEMEPVIEEHWAVSLNPREAPPNRDILRLSKAKPVPRHIYENALVQADQFLQEAGIGLDIEAEPYMADGEPGL